jgi:ADP-heptose:LPS heptosyltransferase
MKILVLRFSAIGDIILTSPVVRCLKLQTDAEIHYATKKTFGHLIANNPYVDAIHLLEDDLQKFISKLKEEKFDVVVDLHHNLRTFRIKKGLGIPAYAFPKYNIRKWVLVNLKWNIMPRLHVVDRYFKAVAPLGVFPDAGGLDVFIPEKEALPLEILPEPWKHGFWAFVIGGNHEGKMCSAAKIARICKLVPYPVVLFGGPDDQNKGQWIAEQAGPHVWNAAGTHSLNGSASLLAFAKLVVTHDTGLMHIASGLGKTIISLWGGTVPELGMTPYRPGPNSLELGASHCMRPSSKLGKRRGIYRFFDFMEMIPDQLIVKEIKSRLDIP